MQVIGTDPSDLPQSADLPRADHELPVDHIDRDMEDVVPEWMEILRPKRPYAYTNLSEVYADGSTRLPIIPPVMTETPTR